MVIFTMKGTTTPKASYLLLIVLRSRRRIVVGVKRDGTPPVHRLGKLVYKATRYSLQNAKVWLGVIATSQ